MWSALQEKNVPTISSIAETWCLDKMSRNAKMPENGFKMPLIRQDLLTTQEFKEHFPGDPDSLLNRSMLENSSTLRMCP